MKSEQKVNKPGFNIRIKSFILVFLVSILSGTTLSAQVKKQDTVQIKASVVCGMCKDRIESSLAYEKGIKDVSVDIDNKTVTVIFKTSSTDVATIRKKISKIGYDADDVPADQAAYNKLPPCCKKDAPAHK